MARAWDMRACDWRRLAWDMRVERWVIEARDMRSITSLNGLSPSTSPLSTSSVSDDFGISMPPSLEFIRERAGASGGGSSGPGPYSSSSSPAVPLISRLRLPSLSAAVGAAGAGAAAAGSSLAEGFAGASSGLASGLALGVGGGSSASSTTEGFFSLDDLLVDAGASLDFVDPAPFLLPGMKERKDSRFFTLPPPPAGSRPSPPLTLAGLFLERFPRRAVSRIFLTSALTPCSTRAFSHLSESASSSPASTYLYRPSACRVTLMRKACLSTRARPTEVASMPRTLMVAVGSRSSSCWKYLR